MEKKKKKKNSWKSCLGKTGIFMSFSGILIKVTEGKNSLNGSIREKEDNHRKFTVIIYSFPFLIFVRCVASFLFLPLLQQNYSKLVEF